MTNKIKSFVKNNVFISVIAGTIFLGGGVAGAMGLTSTDTTTPTEPVPQTATQPAEQPAQPVEPAPTPAPVPQPAPAPATQPTEGGQTVNPNAKYIVFFKEDGTIIDAKEKTGNETGLFYEISPDSYRFILKHGKENVKVTKGTTTTNGVVKEGYGLDSSSPAVPRPIGGGMLPVSK